MKFNAVMVTFHFENPSKRMIDYEAPYNQREPGQNRDRAGLKPGQNRAKTGLASG